MAKQVKLRRGTSAQVAAMTPAVGEAVVDTDKDTICVGDGATAGGVELLRADFDNRSTTDDFSVGGAVGATSAVTAYADGSLKASTGSSGATATTAGDEVVVEGSGANVGMNILATDANTSNIYFGSPSDAAGFIIDWNYDNDLARIRTSHAGASLELSGGNSVTNLTLSGASGSELGQFAGKIGVKTNSSGHAIDIEENSGSESWQIGVDSVGSLNFYDSDSTSWVFKLTDGAPASSMLLDVSGNLLVGKTSTGLGTVGSEFRSTGFSAITRDTTSGNSVLALNKLTGDGVVLDIEQDNVTIGTLGTNGNEFQIKSNGSGSISFNKDVDDASQFYRDTSTTTSPIIQGISNVGGADTEHFKVAADGDVTNTNNSYGAISDVKFKKNIEPMGSQIDDVIWLASKLKKYHLNHQDDGDYKLAGWVAQEIQERCPGLVKTTPDEETVEITETIQEERQVTKTETVTNTEMVIENGSAREVTSVETIEVPVTELIPVLNENGEPKMVLVSPAVESQEEQLDEEGNVVQEAVEAKEAVYKQATYEVPVMETVEVEKTTTKRQPVLDENGEQTVTLSVKYSAAMMKLFKAFGEYVETHP